MEESCTKCKHAKSGNEKGLECRRFPPTPFLAQRSTFIYDSHIKARTDSMYPIVDADTQPCGEFEVTE